MSIFGAQPGEPTMRSYNLSCLVNPIVKGHADVRARGNLGNVEEAMILLVPLEGTQRDMFLGAWAPVGSEEAPEVMCSSGHVGMFKAAVCAPSDVCPHFHLFVMTKDAEDAFLAAAKAHYPQPVRAEVHVYPETHEAAELMSEAEG